MSRCRPVALCLVQSKYQVIYSQLSYSHQVIGKILNSLFHILFSEIELRLYWAHSSSVHSCYLLHIFEWLGGGAHTLPNNAKVR